MTWESLHEGILTEFVEADAWGADDAFKAMSMHVQWHTDRLKRNDEKQTRYRASLQADPAKLAQRRKAKAASQRASYARRAK